VCSILAGLAIWISRKLVIPQSDKLWPLKVFSPPRMAKKPVFSCYNPSEYFVAPILPFPHELKHHSVPVRSYKTKIALQWQLLQEYGFYLVGVASSREFRSSTVLPSFIAAGSRSHKGK
jgi:hypothetical protein